MQAVARGKRRMERVHARQQAGDKAQRSGKIAHALRIERGEFHRAVFREYGQTRAAGGRIAQPTVELGGIVVPVGQRLDRVLRGGDDEAHRRRSQYCIGLALSSVSPCSFQASAVTTPSSGA